MSPPRIAELRQEAVDMFYHGFDNYMDFAFPEDEVRDPPPLRVSMVTNFVRSLDQSPALP
jgi:hypothetical protein